MRILTKFIEEYSLFAVSVYAVVTAMVLAADLRNRELRRKLSSLPFLPRTIVFAAGLLWFVTAPVVFMRNLFQWMGRQLDRLEPAPRQKRPGKLV